MPLDTEEPMNTGDLSRRLGVPVTVELMKSLGFNPVGKNKRADLWNPNEYGAMNDALCKYINGRRGIGPVPKPTRAPSPAPAPAPAPAASGDDFLDEDDDL